MLKYIELVVGAILLSLGWWKYQDGQKKKKDVRIYGLITYVGITVVVVGIVSFLSPYFAQLPEPWNTVIPLFLEFGVLIGGAELFLKPILAKRTDSGGSGGDTSGEHLSPYGKTSRKSPKNKSKKK